MALIEEEATDKEREVLYFLVKKLRGHSVRVIRSGEGSLLGFSVGNGKIVVIKDLIELIKG